jgi:hypothetical protein
MIAGLASRTDAAHCGPLRCLLIVDSTADGKHPMKAASMTTFLPIAGRPQIIIRLRAQFGRQPVDGADKVSDVVEGGRVLRDCIGRTLQTLADDIGLEIPRSRDSASISAMSGSGKRTVKVFMTRNR